MDLKKILGSVENADELIRQIETEIGRDYVPRTEFNDKIAEVKKLEKQVGELNTSLQESTTKAQGHATEIANLTGQVAALERDKLKARIAREVGIPPELADRLAGDDETALKKDAESLAQLITSRKPLPPLKETEPPVDDGKNAAYRALLENINKGE